MYFSFSTRSEIISQFSSGFDFCFMQYMCWTVVAASPVSLSLNFYVILCLADITGNREPAAPGGSSLCTALAMYLSTGRCQCQATLFPSLNK